MLDRAAAARSVLEDLSEVATGSVSIAASQTIANYWLPRRLAAYHAAYPRVRLDVAIGNTRQVETAVVDGAADVGLVEGATQHPALLRQRVDEDRLVLVTASGPPDRRRKSRRGGPTSGRCHGSCARRAPARAPCWRIWPATRA